MSKKEKPKIPDKEPLGTEDILLSKDKKNKDTKKDKKTPFKGKKK
ncbi:hypothetical protein [Methanosarcina mazei]